MLKFEKLEIRDIIISITALSIAVSGIGPDWPGLQQVSINLFSVSIPLSIAFIVHELSHKAIASNFGYRSFYQMWPQGLLFALVIGIASSGKFLFAAPGAVLIQATSSSMRENGIISLAGPLTNLGLAGLFFLLLGLPSIMGHMAAFGVMINLWLALFNLLPFPPLDGSKIFQWKPEIDISLLVLTGFLMYWLFF